MSFGPVINPKISYLRMLKAKRRAPPSSGAPRKRFRADPASSGYRFRMLKSRRSKQQPLVSFRRPLYNISGTVFPSEYVTKVVYDIEWRNQTVNPGLYDWTIRGSGAYDPEYALGGETPAGWTQLAAIYANYYCTGSAIYVTATNRTGAPVTSVILMPRATSTSMIGSDLDQCKSYPGARHIDNLVLESGPKTISSHTSTRTMLGGTLDSTSHAATNASCSRDWYWHIVTYPSSGVAAATDIDITVKVVYTVHFYNLKNQDQVPF